MSSSTNVPSAEVIAGDQALAIAQTDAQTAYQDLSQYRITLLLEADGWHIEFRLRDPRQKGGGPSYVIDAQSGRILKKRYYQ